MLKNLDCMEENMHMQLVDECNVEGATVSDDEGTNRNQVLCDIQKLSDDESVQTSKRWWLFSLLGVQGRHYDDVCKAPSETLSIEEHHPVVLYQCMLHPLGLV